MKAQTFSRRILALLLTLLIAAPSGFAAQSLPELPNPGSPKALSKDQQEQLGLKAMAEVYQQFPVLPDSHPLARYVQDLGRRLVSVIPQQYSWPYQFHVIPEKEINAFALPGGPMFINVGAIQAADNEAQLAGVMAHEMSHVYMQHTAKSLPKQEFAQIFAGILGAVLPGTAAGNLARLGVQIGAGTILMKYSRTDEAQADAVGAIIMYKAGYNPHALADFFKKLESQGGSGPQFLSDHPNPGNREQAISKEVANWPPKSFASSSSAFASAKQETGRTKVYTAQEISNGAKQGIWARQNQQNGAIPKGISTGGNSGSGGSSGSGGPGMANVSLREIQPSDRFTSLQQNDFTISYPDNWQAMNGQGGVTIAPRAGVSEGSIAYGVMIGAGADANAQSLDQATQDLIQNFQQQNPGMRPAGSPGRVDVNGIQGRSVYLNATSPIQKNGEPVPERDWLITLPRSQGGLMYLVFVAPEQDFSQLHPTYQKMLNSLQLQ
jgi:beta-barrel assembly-enhancing protease